MDRKKTALFIIPSLLGILLFMVPVRIDGQVTICVKIIADMIGKGLSAFLPAMCVCIIVCSALLSVLARIMPGPFSRNTVLAENFRVTWPWLVVRIAAAAMVCLSWLGIDAGKDEKGFIHMITESGAGGFVLNDLLTVLVIIFAIAGLLLPLLLDFGLLEFVGAMLTKVMRPVFLIPGRGAIDCITSWIGDGTLGVMLTCNQYDKGYYSAREASVIATNFSAVSITFSLVVLAQVGMVEYFGVYYALICAVGVACALIVPRIPPLSRLKDSYLVPGKAMPETLPEGYSSLTQYAFSLATDRAAQFGGPGKFLLNGLRNSAGMWFGVLPTVMTIGTLSLMLANNTEVFSWLGRPFMPLLDLLRVPEADAVAKTMVVGFVDMFTPSILAAESVTVPMSKFIVATVSVTQLVYLSELGGLILASPLPLRLWDLFIIFIERTIISLLIVCPAAHLIF